MKRLLDSAALRIGLRFAGQLIVRVRRRRAVVAAAAAACAQAETLEARAEALKRRQQRLQDERAAAAARRAQMAQHGSSMEVESLAPTLSTTWSKRGREDVASLSEHVEETAVWRGV